MREVCKVCGYTLDRHCLFDEPGVDHDMSCPQVHHEFKVKEPPSRREGEK